MKANTFALVLQALISVLFLSSCGGSDSREAPPTQVPPPPPPVMVKFSISGQVVDNEVSNAKVTLSVAGKSFSTDADSSGNYQLDVEYEQGSISEQQVITLFAKGVDTQQHIELVSDLGSIARLRAVAGDDVIDDSEVNTNITHVSTALHVLAKHQNNGVIPTSDEVLNTAVASVQPDKLITIASSIKVLADNPDFTPPEGVTTLDMFDEISDPVEALNEFLREQGWIDEQGNHTPEYDDAFTQARMETLAQDAVIESFSQEQLADAAHILMPPHHESYLPKYGTTFLLKADGRGSFGDETGYDYEIRVTDIIWAVENKKLIVSYQDPEPTLSYQLVDEEFISWVTDSFGEALGMQLETWRQNGRLPTRIQQELKRLSSEYTLLIRSDTGGVVAESTIWSHTLLLDEELMAELNPDISLTAQSSSFSGATTWQHSFASLLNETEISGQWALPVLMEIGTGGDGKITDFMHDLVTLHDNGTVTTTLAGNLVGMQWSFSDGAIILSNMENAAASYRYTPYKQVDKQYMALIEKFENEERVSAFSRRIAKAEAEALTAFQQGFVTALPEFYLANVNAHYADMWEDDRLAAEHIFGYQFNSDGSMQRVYSTHADPYLEQGLSIEYDPAQWQIDQGRFTMSRTLEEHQVQIQRHWYVVNQDAEGKYVVLEWEMWVSANDQGLNNVAPRLNVVDKANLSDWPELWQQPPADSYIAISEEDFNATSLSVFSDEELSNFVLTMHFSSNGTVETSGGRIGTWSLNGDEWLDILWQGEVNAESWRLDSLAQSVPGYLVTKKDANGQLAKYRVYSNDTLDYRFDASELTGNSYFIVGVAGFMDEDCELWVIEKMEFTSDTQYRLDDCAAIADEIDSYQVRADGTIYIPSFDESVSLVAYNAALNGWLICWNNDGVDCNAEELGYAFLTLAEAEAYVDSRKP